MLTCAKVCWHSDPGSAPADWAPAGWRIDVDWPPPAGYRQLVDRRSAASCTPPADASFINDWPRATTPLWLFIQAFGVNAIIVNAALALTCGLVVVTLDVERSMTDPPGDVCGPPPPDAFICAACAVVTHFTDKLMAEKPTGTWPVDVSYWYIGLGDIYVYL